MSKLQAKKIILQQSILSINISSPTGLWRALLQKHFSSGFCECCLLLQTGIKYNFLSNTINFVDSWTEELCLFAQAKDWANLFCSLRNQRTGYGRKNVTPYMHSMVYHVPGVMKRHKNVKQFTGQGKTDI